MIPKERRDEGEEKRRKRRKEKEKKRKRKREEEKEKEKEKAKKKQTFCSLFAEIERTIASAVEIIFISFTRTFTFWISGTTILNPFFDSFYFLINYFNMRK